MLAFSSHDSDLRITITYHTLLFFFLGTTQHPPFSPDILTDPRFIHYHSSFNIFWELWNRWYRHRYKTLGFLAVFFFPFLLTQHLTSYQFYRSDHLFHDSIVNYYGYGIHVFFFNQRIKPQKQTIEFQLDRQEEQMGVPSSWKRRGSAFFL